MDSCAKGSFACFGVVYQASNSSCWDLTNSTAAKESNLETGKSGLSTALSNQSQLTANVSCPYANNSVQASSSGVDFNINCNMAINAGSYCPWSPTPCPIHTDSLEECMDYCVEAHPICEAVSWNPGMLGGYQNCYFYDASKVVANTKSYIVHSATLNRPTLSAGCPTDKKYTSTANGTAVEFSISCSQEATSATNLTFVHEANITSCMDSCVSYAGSPGCEAVVFDPTLDTGYENCQLLRSVDLVAAASGVNYASMVSSNSSSPASTSSSGSSSKAWIAGPVIGGVVAIAAIGAGLWWWKRRKRSAAAQASTNPQSAEAMYKSSYPPAYGGVAGTQIPNEPVELPKTPVAGAPTSDLHELPAQDEGTVHELHE